MPTRLLQESEIDLEAEALDLVMSEAEETAAHGSFMVPDTGQDLSDGGHLGRAHIFPTQSGKRVARGRANARLAWMWNGTESVLPLAWDPEGKNHDGARKYLRKRHCLCCGISGFRQLCPDCVGKNCNRCAGGTDKTQNIPNFYLKYEQVPFKQQFYGDVDCFLVTCPRRGKYGFPNQEEMLSHARNRHTGQYLSHREAEASRRSTETDELRRRVDELTSMLLKQPANGNGNAPKKPISEVAREAKRRYAAKIKAAKKPKVQSESTIQ